VRVDGHDRWRVRGESMGVSTAIASGRRRVQLAGIVLRERHLSFTVVRGNGTS